MTLTPGTKLGPYEILSPIGAGGMGEAYCARDPRVGRDVAIKVSAEQFSERFEREARAIAALNHPNIATLYDVGPNYLVMELVEGPTLQERIGKGAIPLDESLTIARQIADALESAHEKGIVHRDLKPGNIKIKPDGTVKVLDFGLAKVEEKTNVNLETSPTLSVAQTAAGVILGTAAYMSPEQARGKSVDKRADIWAFGVVLYEMLTGKRLFQGDTVSDTLAAVLKEEPEWDRIPVKARLLLRSCLQKDPKKRLADISDAKLLLEDAPESTGARRSLLPWIAVVIVLTAITTALVVWTLKPSAPEKALEISRFRYELAKDQQLANYVFQRSLAVSPDGRQIVYATNGGLYLRSMDDLDARLIPETGGNLGNPFFSPDGKWIGYWSGADNQLKKVAISGGSPIKLMDASENIGSYSWGTDDTIVFGLRGKGIGRIPANGGISELIIKQGQDEHLHDPQVLPDGDSVLVTNLFYLPSKIMIYSLKSGKRSVLIEGYSARYLPTGHIVYASGNNLLAVPFDLKNLKVSGKPVPVVNDIWWIEVYLQYAVSDSGTLVYVPGTGIAAANAQRTFLWVDRNGKEESIAAPPSFYQDPRISPDGTRVALAVTAGGNTDIQIWDLVHKNLTRLTFDSDWHYHHHPLWTPDGRRIAYTSGNAGMYGICWKAADGTGKDELLVARGTKHVPASWSGDGKTLVGLECFPTSSTSSNMTDIGTLMLQGDRKWEPLLNEKYNEAQPRISPDGRWMVYTSNESGRNEIYVRPFPDVDKGLWQVSTSGGDSPLWSQDGRQIFYRSGDAVMSVSIKMDPTFSNETPKPLFHGTYVSADFIANEFSPWDISPDGKRFLMMKESRSSPGEGPRRINIVLNWFEELKQRVPAK